MKIRIQVDLEVQRKDGNAARAVEIVCAVSNALDGMCSSDESEFEVDVLKISKGSESRVA